MLPIPQTYLCEPNVLALFSEALAADVETVFADEAGVVFAYTTSPHKSIQPPPQVTHTHTSHTHTHTHTQR